MPHALYIVVIKTSARDAPGCWITEGAPGAAMQVALKATHLLGIHRTGLAIRQSSLAPRRAWPRILPDRPLMYSSLSQCRGPAFTIASVAPSARSASRARRHGRELQCLYRRSGQGRCQSVVTAV